MDINQTENGIERVIIEGRKRLSMTGVEAVDGFSENAVKLTVKGSKVIISGSSMKITAFNKGTGNLSLDGNIDELKYDVKKTPFLKRLFK